MPSTAPSTTGPPSASNDGPPGPTKLTLPVVLAGVALVAMSISGTAIALPSIGEDLTTSGSPLNWVVAGYNLAFAAMTLVAGAAADRAGRRRVFVAATVLFCAGFLITAVAPAIAVLDFARIVSGIGAAGVMAAGGGLLASGYNGAARNRAFALMGTMAGVGIAAGPTLVGALIALTGWRGSFIVFAVVGVLVAIGGSRLAESRAAGARTDWIGSGLFVVALCAMMFALLEAPELGWGHPAVLGALAFGAVGFAVFAVAQRRSANPVLAPELVAERAFMGWCLATLTTSIGFLGALVFLPTYLQAAAEQSPVTAGLSMLLLTGPVLVAPLVAVTLVNRGVSARLLIMTALACVVVGNMGMIVLSAQHTTALVAAPLLLIGIGMGASFGITDGQAMAQVPARLVGTAPGFLNTLRGAAEALVIAGFGAALLGLLTTRVDDPGRAAEVAAGPLATTDAAQRSAEIDAFTASWRLTQIGVGATCLLLSAAVAVLLFRGQARTVRHQA
ncbi:MFS transporter [Nakamurella aerolata]|uniref:MFS transporter n=1 Tax=Nakamurella aerolata TaxID=1656892 RepID=UPI001BB1E23E|nr:MFS transporter [Nakamurella aerolata]